MPSEAVAKRANKDLKEGKAPSTAAGEFVHEEFEHVRRGKHGARSPKQAIAIGLNKARRAGIPLKPPRKGKTSEKTRKSAEQSYAIGQSGAGEKPSPRISRARKTALGKEPHNATSHDALSEQARSASKTRTSRGRYGESTDSAKPESGTARKRATKKTTGKSGRSHGRKGE